MLTNGINLWKWTGTIALTFAFNVLPAFANSANFKPIILSRGFQSSSGVVSGFTGGSISLPAVTTVRDRQNQLCLGFGDPTPDPIMELRADFPELTVEIKSRDLDTTLIIRGPDNTFRCGDNTELSRDAQITDTGWPQGTYQIWVGTKEMGVRRRYRLSVYE
ncbi:hypothetical protein [Laspinema olomoucense]|uniref:Uncharacterized protein n=1 Tax=Laspinema olomoucense D3b TaxID=2953688 RepID=A0ABT2N3D3_9CYAN|nr:hypothetical protein [Laspinema sp. D3b]MCT7977201.1 hypothetical protein [Laspinema sp. D3b]